MQAPTISISDLEERAADGWQAPERDWLGGWLLRAAEGFTGRANSALATGDPGLPVAGAVARVCAWYRARGLPPMIATAFPVTGPGDSEVDRYLSDRGWTVRAGPAVTMTAPSPDPRSPHAWDSRSPHAMAAGRPDGGGPPVEVADVPDDDWLGMYHYRGQELPRIARRLLTSAPWQAFASVREDGQTIAIGRVAASRQWAGLTAIETHPVHRRRGLARSVSAALAAVAAQRGVAGLYLQVEQDNTGARALYLGLGFTDHHRYHYRLAPPEA